MPPRQRATSGQAGNLVDVPDPDQEYVPVHIYPEVRRARLVDIAKSDVILAAKSLSRMREYSLVQRGNRQVVVQKLKEAPKDWYESYSNLKVESWVFMWVQALHGRFQRENFDMGHFEYQYHIAGDYFIGDPPAGKARFTPNRR